MDILIPILTLGVLGLIFGIGLAAASRRFKVETDPRLEKIHGLLPGSNCGACGGAGCFGFAEAVLSGKLKIDACRVANDQAKEEIAKLLGRKLQKMLKSKATLHCNGGKKVKDRFLYRGIEDCVAANLVLGGQKECVFGCLGFGDCAKICPFGAISMNEERLPVVDEDKCTACGKCVEICPKKLFSLVPFDKIYAVRCKSLDMGKDVMKVCPVGCIACHKCEKACPVNAIKVIDNLAIIDYNICDNRGECFKVCPTRTIAKKEDKTWKARI
jgi:RnfABCDGE-type electron transport complex B subunit